MHDVFLSYSRADAVQAAVLDARLTAQGTCCFFDRRELGVGQLWLPDLELAIDAGFAAIVVLCGPGASATRSNTRLGCEPP